MLNKECHHDCNHSYCPFAQDTKNPNRYVCLKCGVEREINRYSGFGSLLMLLLMLFAAFQLIVVLERRNYQNQQQPESAVTIQEEVRIQ
ncbi:hypothetical protein [Anabaena sp. UHCC 0399]|uniref:hypothetical protein n=1 Tax=Anabaena sp. UHCC 0399 TaxID=3110238 RepID=UPI001682BB45|nr:hypothetical protein [Anabaena sp. UHCC 0399]MBD2364284.1 hypothetical protein [Anabaena minutissima FACHB-250]MEA5566061.1 hypothetical protein [Anabaena sp. UHCC 0399]